MSSSAASSLAAMAQHYGLGESYYDYQGKHKIFSDAARSAILTAMGATSTQHNVAAAIPNIWVRTQSERFIDVPATSIAVGTVVALQMQLSDGTALTHQATAELHDAHCRLWLPELPVGEHRLLWQHAAQSVAATLIITPEQCFEPTSIKQGQRLWGLSIQLYTLRSANNWGIGDFADLAQLIRSAAPLGCHTIGLNPLHALRPADASCISPYSPSHRGFLNVLYIAVPQVPEYAHCTAAQALLTQQPELLNHLRATTVVDYLRVSRLKLSALRLLYAEFQQRHLANHTQRASEFQQFVSEQGEALRLHALYDALDQYFSTQVGHHWGWRSWPSDYHSPHSAAVREFADQHVRQVECFMYLQWLANTQLQQAQALAKSQGMLLGLYGDVAVGVDPNGSEVWSNPSLYVDGVGVGAPPDPLALKGQDWGIPPQHPVRLTEQRYQPFLQMLRANMSACGALRIDHVMTLCRLWWVPRGFDATEGVYVHYPLADLLRLVALESERSGCLVIGEDLGTVPDAMRDGMQRFGLYHYKVLFFEKNAQGEFIAPHDYVQRALAVVTTHDLPPFKAWWQGDDIALREQLQLYPDANVLAQVQRERDADKRLLMRALVRVGLWYWQEHEAVPSYSFALMRAAYLYAGLTRSSLLVIQPEDLQAMIEPVNVPGTSTQHANWQRKLSEDVTTTLAKPAVQELLAAMNKARRGEFPNQ